LSSKEAECKLEPYEDMFNEYNHLVISLGYMVLFAPAFPAAALICYVSFLFETRTDAYKLLVNTQRPAYRGVQDIGSWQKVLWFISVVAIFTNVAVIGFTSNTFSSLLPLTVPGTTVTITQANKLGFLLLTALIIILGRYLTISALPDVLSSLSNPPIDLRMMSFAPDRYVRTSDTRCIPSHICRYLKMLSSAVHVRRCTRR
jgi:hypothetical protein